MKLKTILTLVFLYSISQTGNAQLLKKLKKSAENAAERALTKKAEKETEKAIENAFDSIASPNKGNKNSGNESSQSQSSSYGGEAANINSALKREFYTHDVSVTSSEDGKPGTAFFFDADALAMRGEKPDDKQEMFIDSDGFQYAYNDSEGRWEKTGLFRNDASSFMMPIMGTSILKLPDQPMLDAVKENKEKGLNLSTFMIVEWAFIYEPDHFEYEEFTSTEKPDGKTFYYTDPDFKGSYVVFDAKDRLKEVVFNVKTPEGLKNGVFNFDYGSVDVALPNAVEVKMPFQDILMKGMEAIPPDTNTTASNSQKRNKSKKSETIPYQDKPNKISTSPKSDNPFSYEGVTVDLYTNGDHHTYRLDTENWVQELDYNSKLKPTYFDLGGKIYTYEKNRYLCADMKMLANAFGKMFGKMMDSGELGITKQELENLMGENKEIIEMIMNLYDNAPEDLKNAALFPIGNWPYIYGLFRNEIFENDQYEKIVDGSMTTYHPKGDSSKSIQYDGLGRPISIQAKDGHVEFSYDTIHNLSTPTCSN